MEELVQKIILALTDKVGKEELKLCTIMLLLKQHLRTVTAIENKVSKSGCHYSELLLLPYFDAPRMLIIDPMHNLFLETAKYLLKNILIFKGYISHSDLTLLQDKIDSFIVPSGINKIHMKIGGGLSSLTAYQRKN